MSSEERKLRAEARDAGGVVGGYLRRRVPSPDEVRAAVASVWEELDPDGIEVSVHGETRACTPPVDTTRRRPLYWAAAVAVPALAIVVAIVGWPGNDSQAIVEIADGTVYRVDGAETSSVAAGGSIRAYERVRTNGAGAQLALKDGSRIEMRSQSELQFERAEDGVRIRLARGGIIVNAAKQRDGHLYVQTRDMTVAVVGTVFLVNAGDDGSRVAVIEGEVRVRDGKVETRLRPGEQISSRPTQELQVRPVLAEIAWSRRKEAYEALLQSAIAATPVNHDASTQRAAPPASPRPQFEEASIRPCERGNAPSAGRGGSAGVLRMTPGRFYAECVTVAWMIHSAYPPDVPDRPLDRPSGAVASLGGALESIVKARVRGGPSWVYEDRYTIDAIADPSTSTVTLSHPMLWSLLERRLQVKAHDETEHARAFELTVARGGLKIMPIADGETCVTDASRSRLPVGRSGSDDPFRCAIPMKGGWVDGEGPNYRWEVSSNLSSLLTLIRSSQGAVMTAPPVSNRTGIPSNAILNFAVEFGPDETTPSYLQRCAAERERFPRCAERPTAPPLSTALERELGLKLEPATTPREFVVIDRIERPSPN